MYEQFKRDEALNVQQAKFLTPSREFLLAVYNLLKQYHCWYYDVEALAYRANCPVERYCTMLVAIDVLKELGFVKAENGQLVFVGEDKKADLSQSEILKKLNEIQGGE